MAISRADSQEADQIAQQLLDTYQVTLLKDWREHQGEWQGGFWTLQELHTLQETVTALAGAMGGADRFVHNTGGIRVSQVEMGSRGLAAKGVLKLTAAEVSFHHWTIAHELAHTWDANFGWRISKALQSYTGGHTCWPCGLVWRWLGRCDERHRLPGCNRFGYFYAGPPPAGSDVNLNRKEDFAEAVAAYLDPAEAQRRVADYRDSEQYRELLHYEDYTRTNRWAFVDGLMKGIIVP